MDLRSDIYEVFAHYNSLYFDDALGACILNWTDFKNNRSIGTCRYLKEGACEIFLGNQLKLRSDTELKNTLLHEMIHAFLYITEKKKDHSFTAKVEAINRISEFDHMRPSSGYNITASHSLSKEVDDKRIQHWTGTSCGDVIDQGSTIKEPSTSYCCTEKMVADKFCGNNSCHWHRHRKLCSGTYVLNKPGYKGKKPMFPNGTHDDKGNMSTHDDKGNMSTHDDKGNMSTVLPSKRKIIARQLKLSESVDNLSNVKRLKITNGTHDDKGNMSLVSSSKRKLTARQLKLSESTDNSSNVKRLKTTNGTHDDKGNMFVVSSSERKLTARQLKLSESMDNTSNVKKLKTTNGFPDLRNIANQPPCQIPKRPRTTCIRREGKNVIEAFKEAAFKEDHVYSWFDDGEEDEDIEPLINKRTESRKKEKLLKLQLSQLKSANNMENSSGDCVVYLSDEV